VLAQARRELYRILGEGDDAVEQDAGDTVDGEASRALAAVAGEIATNPTLRKAWHRGLAGMLTGCLRTIVSRAVQRGELPPDADVELLSQLPLSLLQNWRLEHDREPDEAVVDRIVRQFYTPAWPPGRRRGSTAQDSTQRAKRRGASS